MRYYFHLIRGNETIIDDQDSSCPTSITHELQSEGYTEKRLEEPRLAGEIVGWIFSVTNGTGDVLFSVPLDFSVPS